jgi:hypothetical protein
MEQNGCFKMALTKAKRSLVEKKERWCVEGEIEKQTLWALLLTLGSSPLADSNKIKKQWQSMGGDRLTISYCCIQK